MRKKVDSLHATALGDADTASRSLVPAWDWSELGKAEHFALFYETDVFLLDALRGFIGSALWAGDSVIVLGTRAHRQRLEKLLREDGLDLDVTGTAGQYVALDARATLGQLLVVDLPDHGRFESVIGGLVERALNGGHNLRIVGEMVALALAKRKYEAAIRLEDLWNQLRKSHPFSLFCAYPMKLCGGKAFADSFNDFCGAHSRVIPGESYTTLANGSDRFRAIVRLQQQALLVASDKKEKRMARMRLKSSRVREQLALEEAESAKRVRDQFLATISHELRTPLNAIIGWSRILRTGKLNKVSTERAIETIDRNARSQAQLIEDILDASQVMARAIRLKAEPLDMGSVIASVIDSVRVPVASKNLQLALMLNPKVPQTIGDPHRLRRVIWHLLTNAIKFTPSGGCIEVRLRRAHRNLEIVVSDTGPGISPQFLPFMFDRFRQADEPQPGPNGGLGLGLSLARHFVELHHGTIRASSPGPGLGATFTVTLPISPLRKTGQGSGTDQRRA